MSVAAPNDVRTGGDMRARSLRPPLVAALGTLLVAALLFVPGGQRADATSPGSNGRIYLGGEEQDIDVGWQAAVAALEGLEGREATGRSA